MPTGTVKWFNETTGFGFIDSDGDVFVHRDDITGGDSNCSLQEGQQVEFEVVGNVREQRREAKNVRVL